MKHDYYKASLQLCTYLQPAFSTVACCLNSSIQRPFSGHQVVVQQHTGAVSYMLPSLCCVLISLQLAWS